MMQSFKYFYDNKFKENLILLVAAVPFNKELLSSLTILEKILNYGCKNYNSKEKIVAKLEDLYGAKVKLTHSCSEKFIHIKLIFGTVDGSLIGDEKLFNDLCMFVHEYLYDVRLKRFKQKDLEHVKKGLVDTIQSQLNQPGVICKKNLIKALDKYDFLVQDSFGSIKEIKETTLNDVYKTHEMISSLPLSCYVIGPIKENIAKETLNKYFNINYVLEVENPSKLPSTKGVEVIKEKNVEQTKVYMLYKYNKDLFKNTKVSSVFSTILGESGNSKLFKEIREKKGLCYSISSQINNKYGLLSISLGVDQSKAIEAVEAIKTLVSNLNITKEELFIAKTMYLSGIDSSMEDPFVLLSALYSHDLLGKVFNYKKIKSDTKKVKLDNLMKLANNLELVGYSILKGVKVNE